ncbi:hypothetical protein HMPREF1582_01472, partial [Gardnerella vaginalis JCP8151A]
PAEPLPPSPPLTCTVTRSTKSLITFTLLDAQYSPDLPAL